MEFRFQNYLIITVQTVKNTSRPESPCYCNSTLICQNITRTDTSAWSYCINKSNSYDCTIAQRLCLQTRKFIQLCIAIYIHKQLLESHIYVHIHMVCIIYWDVINHDQNIT